MPDNRSRLPLHHNYSQDEGRHLSDRYFEYPVDWENFAAACHRQDTQLQSAYSIKHFRYLIMAQYVRSLAELLRRPLVVLEAGIDRGQMLRFCQVYFGSLFSRYINAWYGLDRSTGHAELATAGYDGIFTADLNYALPDVSALPRQPDLLMLLHVLEHLKEPELIFARLIRQYNCRWSAGGFPGCPHPLTGFQQKRLRRKAADFGHVSTFSHKLVSRMACRLDADPLDIRSGFMVRSRNSRLENSCRWVRMNYQFGKLFPGWPSELYWLFRHDLK